MLALRTRRGRRQRQAGRELSWFRLRGAQRGHGVLLDPPNRPLGAGPYLRSRCARAWRLAMAGGTLRRQLWYRLSPSSETRRQAASGTSPKRFRDRSGGTRGTRGDMRDRDGDP